jgi:DEAD/DEAH box helicase domain-containing protein
VERFPRLMSAQKRPTWYEWWSSRFFPQLAMPQINLVENFFEILFRQLEKSGIILQRFQQQHYIWGIDPQALTVRTDVVQYRCNWCGHTVSGSEADAGIWTQMPCFRRNCFGFYQVEYQGLDYYGHLYSNGDIARLYTEEHTGLLERTYRQDLEDQFRKPESERKPWHPNLLSSTPTLEMGIDIGDLSTTVQCSVPPGQANYLQRIGRSGRKDGNGLNMTVAAGRSHDRRGDTTARRFPGCLGSPGAAVHRLLF